MNLNWSTNTNSHYTSLKQAQKIEEEKPNYSASDLSGWEFKILTANTLGGFRTPNVLNQVLQEEAVAGWELVEKFDNYRIRLKRRTQNRQLANQAGNDPYRSVYGPSDVKVITLVFAACGGFALLLFAFVLLALG